MQIDYFPLYYGFKESLQLNGNEIILYSYLINKLRLSVGHGYHGKNGKNYYNDIDEMFYVATSANRLTNIPWIPNNRHTISRYLRHLQSLRLIICHQRRHYTVINFPMIQPVIDALLIDGEIVPPQNHLQNNILHGVAKNKPYDQRSKKAPHVQMDKDVPNVNRNLTESKLNPQSKLNSVTDSTLQKQGYLQWIRNTHSNLGIRKKSLAYISDFCIRYDLTNKDATKFAKLIIEAKNTVMKNNHIRHTESTRFENNKRLQKDLLYSLEDIINQIDMNTHHNRYGKRNKQQHRTPDINHYYGYVVNELKWCFRNCFFDDKDKPRKDIIIDDDQKDDVNNHKDGFGNKRDMKTGKHFKGDKSGDNDSKLNSMDQITNDENGICVSNRLKRQKDTKSRPIKHSNFDVTNMAGDYPRVNSDDQYTVINSRLPDEQEIVTDFNGLAELPMKLGYLRKQYKSKESDSVNQSMMKSIDKFISDNLESHSSTQSTDKTGSYRYKGAYTNSINPFVDSKKVVLPKD